MNRFALVTKRLIIVVGLTLTSLAALADEPKEEGLHIVPQPLSTALREFSEQTGLQVGYASELAEDKSTDGVEGIDDPDLALDTLLAKSGLTHTFVNEQTVVIHPAEMAASDDAGGDSDPGNRATAGATPVVITQNQTGVRQSQASQANERESERKEKRPIEEIVVTGTHIRGTEASIGSKLNVLDRNDIETGGFGTVEEALQSQPVVFRGGVSEDSRSTGDQAGNTLRGSSINLRGLGAGNTLILVNGRRVARGGAGGAFVDISSIPVSIIDRIEVIADGASAIYGSDAIAGVVNIILRDDFEGADTSLRIGNVTTGSSQEFRVSQTFGSNWKTGNVVLSYDYYNRGGLNYKDRIFTASADLTQFGGDDFRTVDSVPGNILDPSTGQTAFAIPNGQDGTTLNVGDLLPGEVNLFNPQEEWSLVVNQVRHSGFVTLVQRFGTNVELFAEGRFSQRKSDLTFKGFPRLLTVPSTNPFFVDPFGGSSSVRIRYHLEKDVGPGTRSGKTTTYNGVLGAKGDLWGDWKARAYGAYSREHINASLKEIVIPALNAALADPNPATAFNPFGDGSYQQNPNTIESIVSFTDTNLRKTLWTANFIVDGSLFDLPAGSVKMAAGYEFKRRIFDREFTSFANSTEALYQRDNHAIFSEILLPLFDEQNRRAGFEQFLVSASVRHEKIQDVGSTTNPKVGILWSPVPSLNFRGTYGTSFRAPDLRELDDSNLGVFDLFFSDPNASTGQSLARVLIGNNSTLTNETSTNWTVGLDYSPSYWRNLTLELTYYNITFKNRITSAPLTLAVLFQEDRFSSAIDRMVTPDDIVQTCALGNFSDFGTGPCNTAPIELIVDFRPINAGITETDGFDFGARYHFDTGNTNKITVALDGTYILSFDEAFDATSPVVSAVNVLGGPVDLKLRGSLRWSDRRGWSLVGYLNYIDNYTDDQSMPNRKIDSWTTTDLALTFDTDHRLSNIGLNNTRFSLNARNVFDESPPFVNNPVGIGYDPENASPLGRFISLNITKQW